MSYTYHLTHNQRAALFGLFNTVLPDDRVEDLITVGVARCVAAEVGFAAQDPASTARHALHGLVQAGLAERRNNAEGQQAFMLTAEGFREAGDRIAQRCSQRLLWQQIEPGNWYTSVAGGIVRLSRGVWEIHPGWMDEVTDNPGEQQAMVDQARNLEKAMRHLEEHFVAERGVALKVGDQTYWVIPDAHHDAAPFDTEQTTLPGAVYEARRQRWEPRWELRSNGTQTSLPDSILGPQNTPEAVFT